jgi:hypothetical protein
VGMSTIPEVLMARYHGMGVAAISCITNCAAGMSAEKLSHVEVLKRGRESGEAAARWVAAFAAGRAKAAGRELPERAVKASGSRSVGRRKNLRIDSQQLLCRSKVT